MVDIHIVLVCHCCRCCVSFRSSSLCLCLSRCCIKTSLQVRSLAHDLSCRLPVDAFKGTHDASHHGAGYAGICLGDPDIGELTISEMSPEDIRAELKRYLHGCLNLKKKELNLTNNIAILFRLYTQLEVLKSKTLRHDNPHISKRRGGRKTPHRRFSLQVKVPENSIYLWCVES